MIRVVIRMRTIPDPGEKRHRIRIQNTEKHNYKDTKAFLKDRKPGLFGS